MRQGKGGKDRMVYLPRSAYALVENWLKVRGEMSGPLLCPVNKGGAEIGVSSALLLVLELKV